ncbi:MAG: FAD-binding oxidoreductase [Gammaproteobacteria bacterium]|nr:FAD-binding oxidoreductase [Gammaproteobacteria bacterium]
MESPFHAGRSAPLPQSLWAAVTPARMTYPALEGHQRADVVVIGAGFMGVAAALTLAERGVEVVLIEAAQIGWGASGRNNGLIAPGLKRDPDDVRKLLGRERGDRLLKYSGDAPRRVFDLIDKHHIACDVNKRGWIQAAHARIALPLIEKRVRLWRELGADVELIPETRVAARLGTDFYAGAWIDSRGGSLNPLAYVRGLAAIAARFGVRLYERTPAGPITRAPRGWTIRTPQGSLQCGQLIYCTNAYADAFADLRGTVVPLRTAQVASAPLTAKQAAAILPGGESASDTQRLLTSFRMTADTRLIMGGASATAGDGEARLIARLREAARERFAAALGEIRWEFGWSGHLALTQDHLPRIIRFEDGSYAGQACNGRGIAMATVTGQAIAELICGQDEKDCSVPIRKPRKVIGISLRHPGVAVAVKLKRLLDRTERRMGG